MITYNMRYRGSYEYDKFVLNILQFHNEVQDMVAEMNTGDQTLTGYKDKLDNLIKKMDNLNLELALITEEQKL